MTEQLEAGKGSQLLLVDQEKAPFSSVGHLAK